jgi:hypothetical protein
MAPPGLQARHSKFLKSRGKALKGSACLAGVY